MSDPDLDEIAGLWRQEPSAEDRRLLESASQQARGTPRLLRSIEIMARLAFAVGLAAMLVWRPSAGAFLVSAAFLILLSWSSEQHDRLSNMARQVELGERRQFLASIRRGAEARLRNARLGLGLYVVGIGFGLLLAHSFANGGDLSSFAMEVTRRFASTKLSMLFLFLLALALARLLQTYFRVKSELGRIRSLERDYEEQAQSELVSPSYDTGTGALPKA